MHQSVVNVHVSDAEERDAEAGAKAQTAKDPRREEAVGAERKGRDAVGDGEDVIRLKGALAREVVRLVQQPDGPVPLLARLQGHRPEAIVPQVLVSVPRVKLHAHRGARDERQLREQLRRRERAAVGDLAEEPEVRGGDGD